MCILFSIIKFLLRFHHEECHWEKKCRQNFFISWNGGWKLEKEVVKLTGWKMFDSLSLESHCSQFKWIFCLHQPEEWNIFFYRHGSYGSQGHSTPTSCICCCASTNPFMTVSTAVPQWPELQLCMNIWFPFVLGGSHYPDRTLCCWFDLNHFLF